MADPQDAYQRTIDFAAKRYATAVDGYHAIEQQLGGFSAADKETGSLREGEYKALNQRLQDASKAWQDAENDYQTALQAQDKARNDAKEFPPAGQPRTRLDTTAGNVLVSVTETADGRGGWSVDPKSIARVTVAGVPGTDTVTAAPTTPWILRNGVLEKNPGYEAPAGSAPTTKVINGKTYQWNATAKTWDDSGLPTEEPTAGAPTTKVVNGKTYQWNPATKKWDDSGLPAESPTASLTPGQTAVDTATAGTAADTASATLAKAQADARTAKAAADDAERKGRQSPTDQQAQQAIATAQRGLDLANQQLENAIKQAGNLNPIAVEQAQATLNATKANTEKGLQGDLYGRAEQIRQIKALVQSGDMSPAEANLAVNALNRGTTVYQAQVQGQADRSSARGQDLSNRNALAGNFTSAMTSGFSTLADMNKYAKVGSTAGADAFLGLLNIAQDRLKSYELPPAQTTDYLNGGGQPSNVSGLIGAAQQAVQQPVPQPVVQQPQPVAAGGGASGINITINQPHPVDQTQGALQSAYQPETSAASTQRNNVGGLVSAAAQKVPVTSEDEIYTAYGVKRPGGGGVM